MISSVSLADFYKFASSFNHTFMNSKYIYQTKYFGVSNDGFHLLRNGFNYKIFAFEDVKELDIKKGKGVKNWAFLLCFGVVCTACALYYAWGVFDFLNGDEGGRIYIEQILIPFFPLAIGVFSIFMALRSTEVVIVHLQHKKEQLPIKELIKAGKLNDFVELMNSKLGSSKVNISSDAIITSI